MLNRLIATFTLWGVRGSLAWFIAHEYTTVVTEKLTAVSHALGGL
ncbi:MAG TPA: hypothetical protein VHT93_18625 [Pseudolabrys sp.]|jgi:hypothetical protein|nr:hypothetical protein [Pseudolabrys sp.]